MTSVMTTTVHHHLTVNNGNSNNTLPLSSWMKMVMRAAPWFWPPWLWPCWLHHFYHQEQQQWQLPQPPLWSWLLRPWPHPEPPTSRTKMVTMAMATTTMVRTTVPLPHHKHDHGHDHPTAFTNNSNNRFNKCLRTLATTPTDPSTLNMITTMSLPSPPIKAMTTLTTTCKQWWPTTCERRQPTTSNINGHYHNHYHPPQQVAIDGPSHCYAHHDNLDGMALPSQHVDKCYHPSESTPMALYYAHHNDLDNHGFTISAHWQVTLPQWVDVKGSIAVLTQTTRLHTIMLMSPTTPAGQCWQSHCHYYKSPAMTALLQPAVQHAYHYPCMSTTRTSAVTTATAWGSQQDGHM